MLATNVRPVDLYISDSPSMCDGTSEWSESDSGSGRPGEGPDRAAGERGDCSFFRRHCIKKRYRPRLPVGPVITAGLVTESCQRVHNNFNSILRIGIVTSPEDMSHR